MGKTKSKQTGTTSPPHQFKDNSSFVASTTANVLSKSGAFVYALEALNTLLVHWKNVLGDPYAAGGGVGSSQSAQPSGGSSGPGVQLLKPIKHGPKPDISILIPHNYLKNYPDIFESYDGLLTEIIVRLPYQILRLQRVLFCCCPRLILYRRRPAMCWPRFTEPGQRTTATRMECFYSSFMENCRLCNQSSRN